MRSLLILIAALALGAAACGSGDAGTGETLPFDEITTTVAGATQDESESEESPAVGAEAADDASEGSEPSDGDSATTTDDDSASGNQIDENPSPSGRDGAAVVVHAERATAVAVSGDSLPFFDSNAADGAVGLEAPAFAGPGLSGDLIEVTPGDGPLIVLFLAHWCPHCQREVPALVDYFAANPVPDGVEIVAVATSNDATRTNYPAADWLEREDWGIPTIVDDDVSSIAAGYGLSAFPFYAFVDGAGIVAGRVAGEQTVETIGAVLTSLADGYLVPDSARPGAALDAFRQQPTACGGSQPGAPAAMAFDAPEPIDLTGSQPRLVLATSCGELRIDLDPDVAPSTVASMVFLAEQGYFDGTVCHRYVRGFVLQCGDPTATGTGGPGYVLPDEFPADGFSYSRGVVAMANAGAGTTGSQFFIVTGEETGLGNQFTVIGTVEVTDDFLAGLNGVPLGPNDFGETSVPLETIYVELATVDR